MDNCLVLQVSLLMGSNHLFIICSDELMHIFMLKHILNKNIGKFEVQRNY